MLQESAETFGDLFLDIAEAYMEMGFYPKAQSILKKLVTSETYNKVRLRDLHLVMVQKLTTSQVLKTCNIIHLRNLLQFQDRPQKPTTI